MDFGLIFDRIFHHGEYASLGQNGERHLYRELKKLGVPPDRMFRNVYVPLENGKTTEIDIVVVSRKGILVFEHKAYQGVIYGDGRRKEWVQYLGGKKSFFRSPIEQNRYHVERLKEYLGENVPIYGFISHSLCGKWKVKNIPEEAHFLEREGQFVRIYNSLPDDVTMMGKFKMLKERFAKLSRPTDGAREKHVEEFGKRS